MHPGKNEVARCKTNGKQRRERFSTSSGVEIKPIYEELKRRMILVRYMSYEGYGDGLRISVGTDAEIDRLVEEIKQLG